MWYTLDIFVRSNEYLTQAENGEPKKVPHTNSKWRTSLGEYLTQAENGEPKKVPHTNSKWRTSPTNFPLTYHWSIFPVTHFGSNFTSLHDVGMCTNVGLIQLNSQSQTVFSKKK